MGREIFDSSLTRLFRCPQSTVLTLIANVHFSRSPWFSFAPLTNEYGASHLQKRRAYRSITHAIAVIDERASPRLDSQTHTQRPQTQRPQTQHLYTQHQQTHTPTRATRRANNVCKGIIRYMNLVCELGVGAGYANSREVWCWCYTSVHSVLQV